MKVCSVDGCGRATHAKGTCSMHFLRLKRRGDVGGPGFERNPLGDACAIAGCAGRPTAKGWCSMHYARWIRHGDPMGGRQRFADPKDAFQSRTEWQGDCLVWTGAKTVGYESMRIGTQSGPAHRFAWEQAHGPIPDGLQVDHICRNRACCNVAHLRLVTHKQNHENIDVPSSNTSGYRGAILDRRSGKWSARVRHNYRDYYGGEYSTAEEAGEAARQLRLKLHTHNTLDRNI